MDFYLPLVVAALKAAVAEVGRWLARRTIGLLLVFRRSQQPLPPSFAEEQLEELAELIRNARADKGDTE